MPDAEVAAKPTASTGSGDFTAQLGQLLQQGRADYQQLYYGQQQCGNAQQYGNFGLMATAGGCNTAIDVCNTGLNNLTVTSNASPANYYSARSLKS